jgi:hypothetical protein
VELTTVSQFVNGLYRILGTDSTDDALVAHGEAVNEVAYTALTQGCRDAQRWLLKMGYKGWTKRSAALSWSGTDDADGGRYTALPADFLRAAGSAKKSALREADGDGWGQEVGLDQEQARGNGYYLKGGELWLCRGANPPTTVYLAYHYTHPLWSAALTTIDFPMDARPLIIAEAANIGKEENWLPLGADGEQKIERNLMRWREKARDVARPSNQPRTLKKTARMGSRY